MESREFRSLCARPKRARDAPTEDTPCPGFQLATVVRRTFLALDEEGCYSPHVENP